MNNIKYYIQEKLVINKNSKCKSDASILFTNLDDSAYKWTDNSYKEVEQCKKDVYEFVNNNLYLSNKPSERIKLFFIDTYKQYLKHTSDKTDQQIQERYNHSIRYLNKYGWDYYAVEQGYWHYMNYIINQYKSS